MHWDQSSCLSGLGSTAISRHSSSSFCSLDFAYHLWIDELDEKEDDSGCIIKSNRMAVSREEGLRREASPPPAAYEDGNALSEPASPAARTARGSREVDLEAGMSSKQDARQRTFLRGLETGQGSTGSQIGASHAASCVGLKSEREMRNLLSFEWALLKKGVPSSRPPLFFFLLWVFVEYVHLTAHNYVYFLQGKIWGVDGPPPPLPDLGLMLLADRLPDRYEWIIGFATAVLVGLMFSLGLLRLTLAHVKWGGPQIEVRDADNQHKTTLPMPVSLVMQRACQAMSVGMSLRVVTFLVTLVPNPAAYCHGPDWDPPERVGEIFTRIRFTGSCGDLLFSGHTSHGMVLMLVVTRYAPKVRAAKALSIGAMTLLALSLLAFKSHYTSDVLVAVYVNLMIWWLLPTDPARVNLTDLGLNNNFPLPVSPAFVCVDPSSSSVTRGTKDETKHSAMAGSGIACEAMVAHHGRGAGGEGVGDGWNGLEEGRG